MADRGLPLFSCLLPALQHHLPPLLPHVQQYLLIDSEIYTITNRFDYAGVCILISGSAFPPLYYGLYCQLEVAIVYLTVTILIGIFCFTVCIFEWIHRPGHAKYKGMMFAGFGCSLGIPVAHMVINEVFFGNYGDPFEFSNAVPYVILLGASYLGGVYVYVARCPERHNPGKYNVCGSSHQIWHGFVLFGVFFTYLASMQQYEMRKASVCPA